MKPLLFGSAVAGVLLFLTDVKATEFDMFVCQDCSFNEAQQFALQRGAPQITCQPAPGQVVIDPDNQQCFSGAKDYLVLDNRTKTLYAFTLTHSNQGGQPWDMVLNANTFTPTSELNSLAVNTASLKEHVNSTLDNMSVELSRTFTSSAEIADFTSNTTNYATSAFSTLSAEGCENDPGYEAAIMAFTPSFMQEVSNTMHTIYRREIDNGVEGQFFSSLDSARFTSAGLQVGKGSLGVNASWEYIIVRKQIQFDLAWTGSGNNHSPELNRIVVDLDLNELGTTVVSTMNTQQTYIGGVSLENMSPDNSTLNFPLINNDCVAQALTDSLSWIMTDSGAGVIGGSGWNENAPPGGGGMPIPGGGSSWNTSSPDLCRQHHYKNGERIITILVPCP